MIPVLTALYILAAALPLLGFARLLYRAQVALNKARAVVEGRGGNPAALFTDLNQEYADIRSAPMRERNALIWDIALVGLGLISGAAASVWSLHI